MGPNHILPSPPFTRLVYNDFVMSRFQETSILSLNLGVLFALKRSAYQVTSRKRFYLYLCHRKTTFDTIYTNQGSIWGGWLGVWTLFDFAEFGQFWSLFAKNVQISWKFIDFRWKWQFSKNLICPQSIPDTNTTLCCNWDQGSNWRGANGVLVTLELEFSKNWSL